MIGIVYSSRTGRIRSIVVPDEGEVVEVNLSPGEDLAQFPNLTTELPDVLKLQTELNIRTGIIPKGDAYQPIAGGAICFLDPDCGDELNGYRLVA